jgi:ATP-binding cassette subfamily C (CFTR/MRP) protein 1
MLPQGDSTEIGERGITVSGGQKQRLNIARAIYFDADLILMDDPLSAVDAHVGRHIFDNAIMGLLKEKARILATHQLWVLNRCDRIIWLEEGKIQAIDTFDNLMKNHVGFQQLMETTAVEENQEDDQHTSENENEVEKKIAKKKPKAAALMQAEERAVKSVPWTVYTDYIRASGTLFNAVIVIGLLVLSQGANIATSLWCKFSHELLGCSKLTIGSELVDQQPLGLFYTSLYRRLCGSRCMPGPAVIFLFRHSHNFWHIGK